ncbi:hypothetical protein [Sphaerisporangium perillae]|uniref:hypothetical protein n=1 Tax=Sphaerisporangium perillae TaxID=2935860 RepID=UPI00200C6D7D|nr:hypothetical protein [Sphaerisporangium perillae]
MGERIPLEWTVLGQSPLVSSAKLAAGGRLSVTGTVDVTGLWQGQLDSTGSKDEGELGPGAILELPAAISGSVATSKEGKLSITPRDLVFDFTPPAETVPINDTANLKEPTNLEQGPITYAGDWVYAGNRAGLGDHDEDVHAATDVDAKATVTFVGTGIEFLAEQADNMGKVRISVDPSNGTDVTVVNAYAKGVPHEHPLTQQLLWSKTDLPYDRHTVTFEKVPDVQGEGPYMVMDRFNLITGVLKSPPKYFKTTCKYMGEASLATVDVLPASNNGGNDNNGTGGNGQVTDGDDSVRGVVIVPGDGSGHGAPTATASPTPKATKTTKKPKPSTTPQVRVTPKGGAHTGEAPEHDTSAPALIGYGTALTLGGLVGGLALRRRRAAHRTLGRGNAG